MWNLRSIKIVTNGDMSFTSYAIENDRAFREALKKASESVEDLRLPFGQILKDFYRSEQAIFKLQGPGLYPAISEKYGKRKQKEVGFKYPLLVKSGRLAGSLLGPNNAGSISSIGKQSMYFGTSVDYAIYHQSDAPRKKIPQRKVLFIGPEAPRFANSDQVGRLQRWLGYINDHIANKAKQAGFPVKGGK